MDCYFKEKSLDEIKNETYYVVRYTNLVDADKFVDDYEKITKELENKGYKVKRIKNTFNDENFSYKGLNTVVESPTGYKFELQYHTPESLEINHKLYEKARLDTTSLKEKEILKEEMKQNAKKIKSIPNINSIKNMNDLKADINEKIKDN